MSEINLGRLFAYAFFCPHAQVTHPTSTFTFSTLRRGHRGVRSDPRIVNIMWRVDQHDALLPYVSSLTDKQIYMSMLLERTKDILNQLEKDFPAVVLRGIFTDNRFLLDTHGMVFRQIGEPISLDVFANGLIVRPPQLTAEEKFRLRTRCSTAGLVKYDFGS